MDCMQGGGINRPAVELKNYIILLKHTCSSIGLQLAHGHLRIPSFNANANTQVQQLFVCNTLVDMHGTCKSESDMSTSFAFQAIDDLCALIP